MQKVSGTFIASDAAININLGFVPSHFKAWSALAGTLLTYDWYKALYDGYIAGTGAIDCAYGMVDAAAGKTSLETEASGIIPYNTQTKGVKLPAPKGISADNPDGLTAVSVADFVAGAAQPTARTTAVVGTAKRPSVHNGRVYECTTSAGVLGTEPTTWPTVPGEIVADGNSNYWTCRQEIICDIGGKGVTLGVDICTNGEIWVYEAELHEQVEDKGDADLKSPI